MPGFEVHRFELRSHDERDLDSRLRTFRHAVHSRQGAILDIQWAPRTSKGHLVATVLYELPCATGHDDAA